MIRRLLCTVATVSVLAASSAGCSEQKLNPPPAAPGPDYSAYVSPGATSLLARPAAGPAQGPKQQTSPEDEAGKICPMRVPGTLVSAVDTPNGIILTFTTAAGSVDDLQARVHHMGNMHNAKVSQAAPGIGMGPMWTAGEIADIPGGVKITFHADKARDVAVLRNTVRMHAQRMQSGDCSMAAMTFTEG